MYEYDSLASPAVVRSLDRGIALLRWGGFWSAICLPLVHVLLLVGVGFSPSTTPVILALWLANLAAFVLGRQHSPRTAVDGVTEGGGGGDRR
jgi:hypothetical protein